MFGYGYRLNCFRIRFGRIAYGNLNEAEQFRSLFVLIDDRYRFSGNFHAFDSNDRRKYRKKCNSDDKFWTK